MGTTYKVKIQRGIEVKRFYLPIKIKHKCSCGKNILIDLDNDYLSFPTINKKETFGFYCSKCEKDFEIKLILKIEVEAFSESVKEV